MSANKTFFTFIKEIFQDPDGNYSSKRTTAFIATICLVIAFFADIFFGLTVTEFIFNGFLMLDLGALGITGFEALASKITTSRVRPTTTVNAQLASVNSSTSAGE